MNIDQLQFLKDEFFSLTLMATVQRAGVYNDNTEERQRRAFREALRSELEELAKQYNRGVDEETHLRNIRHLCKSLTSNHTRVLKNGRFRTGTAQKALNLYLKYLWCLGEIPMPPHCPFDFQIIGKLRRYNGPKWTELDSLGDYRRLVAAAHSEAKNMPLALWELRAYNSAQPRPSKSVKRGQ